MREYSSPASGTLVLEPKEEKGKMKCCHFSWTNVILVLEPSKWRAGTLAEMSQTVRWCKNQKERANDALVLEPGKHYTATRARKMARGYLSRSEANGVLRLESDNRCIGT